MDPTPLQVFDAVRLHLSDLDVQGGEVFTNDLLYQYFTLAYQELWSALQENGINRADQKTYYNLPAGTVVLDPRDVGINNFGELIDLRERRIGATKVIESATSAAPIVLQITAHGRGPEEVFISGMTGMPAANGRWYTSIPDANHITLIGSNASGGVYTSGGVLTTSPYDFVRVRKVDQLARRQTPMSSLDFFEWREDKFFFNPTSEDVELEFWYSASGAAPGWSLSSSPIGMDDSLNFFAYRVAALAGRSKQGYADLAAQMAVEAREALRAWINIQVRSMAKVRPREFRRRNRLPIW